MKLFEEYKIKNMTLKNRIVMPPMCMYQVFNIFSTKVQFSTEKRRCYKTFVLQQPRYSVSTAFSCKLYK